MVRKFLYSGLAAALAAAVFAGGLSASADAKTYKWITFKPKGAGDAQAVTTQWFADEFAKRTGGKHKIEIFWGGSVAKVKEVPKFLQAGAGDFGDIVTPYFQDQFPLNNAVGFFIPQPHSTIEIASMMERWHTVYPQFDAEMKKYNLKTIGFRPLENYGVLCTKPVKTLADFKGMRIRTYGFAYPPLVEAMGGVPVSMGTTSAYEALQRGILDCTPIGPVLARGWKFDEVAKYYIDISFGASFGHMITMNRKTYDEMDEVTRDIVEGLGREYSVKYAVELDIATQKVHDAWKKMGVEIVPFPKAELAKVVSDPGVKKVRAKWIERANSLGIPADAIAAELKF